MEKQIDTPTNTPTKSQYTNCEIEEMAKAIHINCHKGLTEDEAKMIAKWCYQEIDRKASSVAEEIFEIVDITLKVDERDFERQFIESDNEKDAYVALALENYVHGVRKVFAELKKKYTEGGE